MSFVVFVPFEALIKFYCYCLLLNLVRNRLCLPKQIVALCDYLKMAKYIEVNRILEGSFPHVVNCKTLKFIWNMPNVASL